MRAAFPILCAVLVAACAGKVDYVRPTSTAPVGSNVKVIDKPRDVVWAAAVPELGKRFFVINNLDKASGLINVSYSGDPEKYVDCGQITSYVKNARGERTYAFAGAKAQQSYEIMDPNSGLFFIDRRMALDGRVNLIFEEVSPTQTRVTANTRYVVNRKRTVTNVNNQSRTIDDSVNFNSGGSGTFAGEAGQAAECAATGALERELLDAIR